MRNFLYFVFCCALFGCKKQGNGKCKLVSIEKGFFAPEKTTFEYDQQGRIIKVTGPYPSTLSYYSDSVVVVDQSSITTYFIASSGLASTSKSRSSFPDPGQPTYEYNYTYNSDGYLIQMAGIYSRLVNGITARDTLSWRFTIQNGNITEYWSGNVLAGTYQYTNLVAKENIAFTNQPIYPWRFLGKFSRNLLSSMPSINGTIRFEYEFDIENNIVKRKESHTGFPSYAITTNFTYKCD